MLTHNRSTTTCAENEYSTCLGVLATTEATQVGIHHFLQVFHQTVETPLHIILEVIKILQRVGKKTGLLHHHKKTL